MQIEHFSLIEQIHTNQCANNCDARRLSSSHGASPYVLSGDAWPVDGNRDLVTK